MTLHSKAIIPAGPNPDTSVGFIITTLTVVTPHLKSPKRLHYTNCYSGRDYAEDAATENPHSERNFSESAITGAARGVCNRLGRVYQLDTAASVAQRQAASLRECVWACDSVGLLQLRGQAIGSTSGFWTAVAAAGRQAQDEIRRRREIDAMTD